MRMSPRGIKAINTPTIRVLLAAALRCTEQTIMRHIAANERGKHDNLLTTAAALKVARKETKLDDSELLVEEGAICDHGGH